ncbi:PilZ domain-containing protein [Thiomicrorhabdus indica]|uniref:PilZ domain-containing protein n=1 Tax=Thiomicrorhabdus indica TaxID=2267253 RepID=UPI002AA85913|nr:PilZ domain-containing protein [Thiomicrorhabdus indica]
MTNQSLTEKRCSERVLIRRPVKFTPLKHTDSSDRRLSPNDTLEHQQWNSANLIDLSDCGMGLICDRVAQPNECWLISLSLPTYDNDSPLILRAKVIRSEKIRQQYLIGLEMLHPSAHDLIVIHDFFRYHQRFFA